MAATYQNMSYYDIRQISQFSNVSPGSSNVLWGVNGNQYDGNDENDLNPDGTTWKWLCNAIDIYWGKPTLNTTGNVTSVSNSTIATTTDLLKFIENTAQVVNNLGDNISSLDDDIRSLERTFVERIKEPSTISTSANSDYMTLKIPYLYGWDDDISYETNEVEFSAATESSAGVMSAEDKQKLNNIPDNIIVDINNYKTENATLPIDDGYIYYDSNLSYGKYINLERISLATSDEDGHIKGSRGSNNEPFYIFRNNVGQDDESFDVWDCSGTYHGRWNEYDGYNGPKSEIYDNDEHPIDVIGYIKEVLYENIVSEYKDGLMSAEDKLKLDNLVTIFHYSQYCKPNGKIPFNTDFSNYILPCNVEMRRWRNNEYYYLCFANNELGDIDDTDNTNWRLRKNYYLFMLQDASGQDTDNYTYVGEYPNTIVLSDQTALDAKVAEAFGYSNNSSNS